MGSDPQSYLWAMDKAIHREVCGHLEERVIVQDAQLLRNQQEIAGLRFVLGSLLRETKRFYDENTPTSFHKDDLVECAIQNAEVELR